MSSADNKKSPFEADAHFNNKGCRAICTVLWSCLRYRNAWQTIVRYIFLYKITYILLLNRLPIKMYYRQPRVRVIGVFITGNFNEIFIKFEIGHLTYCGPLYITCYWKDRIRYVMQIDYNFYNKLRCDFRANRFCNQR